MREIKFRTWQKKQKTMSSCNSPRIGYEGDSLNSQFLEADIIFMQFTGLRDGNGKEIYEGDIFDFCESGEDEEVERGHIYWDNLLSTYFIQTVDADEAEFSMVLKSEILGNIYENPELLNQ